MVSFGISLVTDWDNGEGTKDDLGFVLDGSAVGFAFVDSEEKMPEERGVFPVEERTDGAPNGVEFGVC